MVIDEVAWVHPYVPNSAPETREKMLEIVGVGDIDDLYDYIPESLRLGKEMDLPGALGSERALQRHLEGLLGCNITTERRLSFLGGGCWQHHVPAICDEIVGRAEFLTAYAGEPYEDHGRFQALFEYASMVGELVDMDVVSVPTYDWATAAAMSMRMAARMTGRAEIIVPETIAPDRLQVVANYLGPGISVQLVSRDSRTGCMDLDDLDAGLSERTAAVYFENPSYLGFIEDRGADISRAAKSVGAISIVGVDPSSLGVMIPPTRYGADIVCGELQPLGVHMSFGGGLAGFIATRDEVSFVREYPLRLFGLTSTAVEGEHGFGDVFYDRTSFAKRERGKDFVGTMAALWGIAAGVYLALMGPQGMVDLGTTIMQRAQYAAALISAVDGVRAPYFCSPFFKEFVVDFNGTEKTVREINRELLNLGIFGGRDLSASFPEMGQCALYSVTEVHTQGDIDRLAEALHRCVGRAPRHKVGEQHG